MARRVKRGQQTRPHCPKVREKQGAQGLQGPAGVGTSVEGALVFVPAGFPAPAGYELVGTFDVEPSGGPRGRKFQLRLDIYRRP